MSYFTTTINFADGMVATSARLDEIVGGLRLASDSVDGSTLTLSAGGVLSLGTVVAANYGAASIPTAAYQNLSVGNAALGLLSVATGNIQLLAVTDALIAATTITFGKLATAAVATQAEMQSETASKLATASTLKYHGGVFKAWGILTMADGTIAGGSGITGSATGTATSRTVTLAATMANTNYRVHFSQEDAATTGNAPVITNKTTTTFTVASGATKIAFDVAGQLA